MLPENIPSVVLGPLIALAVHLFLTCQSLLRGLINPGMKELKSLSLFYASVATLFLGTTVISLQFSEPAIHWGGRTATLGTCWLPVGWIYLIAALEGKRAGRVGRLAIGVAVLLSLVLVFIDHPASLSRPLIYVERLGLWFPAPSPVRVAANCLTYTLTIVYIVKMCRDHRRGGEAFGYGCLFATGLFLFLLGGLHDFALHSGWPTPFPCPVAWAGSICLSLFLSLAMAWQYRNLQARLRRQNEALVEARSLAVLGAGAAAVAHQVGGFLNKLAFAFGILKADKLSPDSLETLETMERGASQLADFNRRFLTFARRPRLNLARLSLGQALRQVIKQCRSAIEAGRVVVEVSDDQRLEVVGDLVLLHQAFVNVLTNSLEAVNGQGRISIAIRPAEGGFVEVSFEDNGPGMDRAQQEEVFKSFRTTKAEGIGLGLPLVRNIIEAHSGRVRLESWPGRGTLVTLSLPASPEGWSSGQRG